MTPWRGDDTLHVPLIPSRTLWLFAGALVAVYLLGRTLPC